jgi:hypothetical protein
MSASRCGPRTERSSGIGLRSEADLLLRAAPLFETGETLTDKPAIDMTPNTEPRVVAGDLNGGDTTARAAENSKVLEVKMSSQL